MAFQTNVFRNGEWVTETIDLQTILKAPPTTTAPSPPLPAAPACAILTRTIIESPVVHWILPARLRSIYQHDVAFVGDQFVQISELREDGQLHQVARKTDFGSRICNARVIGNTYETFPGSEDLAPNAIKIEDGEGITARSPRSRLSTRKESLPPHLLLLILENGAFAFLFIKRSLGRRFDFGVVQYKPPPKKLGDLTFHLSVDPLSRYIAVSGIENKIVVYEMESREQMDYQYSRSETFSPIRKFYPRGVQGVIHKMEFLHPRPEDEDHAILLLILARNGISMMVIYEWNSGSELSQAFAEEKLGHRLPSDYQMPLLVIPLTVRNSFFAVSQHSIGICKDPLQGPPVFEVVDPGTHGPTEFHHGLAGPLWTAWDRPVRRSGYYENKDNIYLAREDGVIVFLEINSVDILGAAMNVGCCNCSISTAFTTVYDTFTDVAIICGDSGPGTICKLRPRAPLIELGTVANWSPILDFVTTDEFTSWNQHQSHKGNLMVPWPKRTREHLAGPDRLFSTSGKGRQGTVTELRHGIQANIGLDLLFGSPMKQSWIFPADLPTHESGYYLLLALPDASNVLYVSGDLGSVTAPDPGSIPFDTGARTLAATQNQDQMIIQVTEDSLTLVTPVHSSRHDLSSFGEERGKAEHASIRGPFVTFSTHLRSHSFINLVQIDQMAINLVQRYEIDGEVTCLSFCEISKEPYVLAGLWREDVPWLAAYLVSADVEAPAILIPITHDTVDVGTESDRDAASDLTSAIEALTSVVAIQEDAEETILALGTRGGFMITIRLTGKRPPFQNNIRIEKFGIMAVEVYPVESPFLQGSVLVYCDASLLLLRGFESRRSGTFKTKLRIWITDANNPNMASPPINSATSLRQNLSGQPDHLALLVLADDRILVTELAPHGKLVPRHLPLNGTPTKLLYSHTLQCLIVGLKTEDKPTLQFLDPETGENMARPTDRSGEGVEFISGLGNSGDRIQGLYEWLYPKDGKTWLFIIVTTQEGRLLIISTEKEGNHDTDARARKIRYWTRYKKKGIKDPIYSVVGDAEGLIYCAGTVLHWEVLDLSEKRLKPKKIFEINSPATELQVVRNKIYALTTQHSLIVINHSAESQHEDMTIVHSDEVARYTMHMIEMGPTDTRSPAWPITLLCDQRRGFAGVWIPWEEPGKEFKTVFEGELPATVRKLRRGHTRPPWISAGRTPRYGSIPSTVDGAEILGICLDGSMRHFALLDLKAWKFLRLIQNLALRDALLYPFTFERGGRVRPHLQAGGTYDALEEDDEDEYDAEPMQSPSSMMHIDGDMLQRCMEQRALERLVSDDNNIDMLREYLDDLDGGKWTAEFQDENDIGKYFELGYDVLEHYLAPVL